MKLNGILLYNTTMEQSELDHGFVIHKMSSYEISREYSY